MPYFEFKQWGGPDFVEALKLALQDTYAFREVSAKEFNLPEEYEDIHLETVEEISDINVVGTGQLSDDKRLVSIEARLGCNLEVFIFKPNHYFVEDDPRLQIANSDWNKHYMRGELYLSLPSRVRLMLDKSDPEREKIAALSIEPIIPDDQRLDRAYFPRFHPMRRITNRGI